MENKRDSPSSSSPPSSIKSITSELKEKNNKFSDKERIRLEEEGLCEDDFKRIPVDPNEEIQAPELLKSQGESCWDSKQLVTLADLGNWTEDLSPVREEKVTVEKPDVQPPPALPPSSLKQKIKRPMKRKKKKAADGCDSKLLKL